MIRADFYMIAHFGLHPFFFGNTIAGLFIYMIRLRAVTPLEYPLS